MLAPNLPPLPDRMKKLPLDSRGFPVPKFVAYVGNDWDFRVIRPGWIAHCVVKKACWLCGEPMGKWKVFVIGPMCAVNKVNSEPPSHYSCAQFAAKACPFLTQPKRMRNEHGLPGDTIDAAGQMIRRNPGVTCLWITDRYEPFKVDNGVLFHLGPPWRVEWWARGREATRDEVLASIESGYPLLLEMARAEGAAAVTALEACRAEAIRLLPT
jgi:hypothetical protein